MPCSWGLNLFVLFELCLKVEEHILRSWGLNLFVLFERRMSKSLYSLGSWGLNLFVLFELFSLTTSIASSSWGLNLFVLFELFHVSVFLIIVLEDWIYLYYLNNAYYFISSSSFLRIEFICIIWTSIANYLKYTSSWGLNLFVLFERKI